MRDKLGIIFAPGGFLGAYSVGFAKAVSEKGIKPAYIQGSSVGALNAAMFIQEDCRTEKLESIWDEVEKKGPSLIFNKREVPRNVLMMRNYLFSNKGLRYLVNYLDARKIISSDIEFRVVVFNETTREREIFSNHEEQFRRFPEQFLEVIFASASITGIFPPVPLGGYLYSDGGVFNIKDALDFGCNRVFVFLNDPVEHEKKKGQTDRFWLRMTLAYHYVYDQFLEAELDLCDDRVIVFRAEKRVLAVDHFKKGKISLAKKIGYRKAVKILENIK